MYNGSPLPSRSFTFTSTDADLDPIESSIRSSLAFGGRIGAAGFAWDFNGLTEDYAVLPNTHAGPVPHGGGLPPVGIGSYNALQVELCNLSIDATLAGLLAGVTLPALPLPPIVEDTGLRFRFEDSRLSWTSVPAFPAPGAPMVPALRMDLPLELRDVDLADFTDLLFDIDGYTLPVTVDIVPTPCGDCTNPAVPCNDAPGAVAAGYRTSIATALGYAPTDVNATYRDVGLNLNVTTGPPTPPTGTRLAGVTGGTSFTAACPFAVGDLNTLELFRALDVDALAPEARALSILINIARGLFAPLRYLLGLIICEVVTDIIDGQVRDQIGSVPSSLQATFATLVNPPVLNRTLTGLGGLAAALPAGTAADRIIAQLQLNGGPIGAVPVAPVTTLGGAYTDGFFNLLAQGGCATAATNLNLNPLINACAAGVGLTPLDTAPGGVCQACTAGGVCGVGAGGAPIPCACAPGTACAFACQAGGGFLPNVATPVVATTPAVLACPPAYCATVPGYTPPGFCPLAPGAPVPVSMLCPAIGGIQVQPAPNLAGLLSAAPLMAETIRRWFSSALPGGARYTAAASVAGTPGTTSFSYVVDAEDDCAPDETDVCRGVFDPLQLDDGDGDDFGAACDLCPGVSDSSRTANLDDDADGVANACDCDRDGDGCINEGASLAGACTVPVGSVFDASPRRVGVDFDGDGVNDDCDNDRDGDGVLEFPLDGSPADNCPLGDGDELFEPDDTNPDQTNTGGLPEGDLCDPTCSPARGITILCSVADTSGGGGIRARLALRRDPRLEPLCWASIGRRTVRPRGLPLVPRHGVRPMLAAGFVRFDHPRGNAGPDLHAYRRAAGGPHRRLLVSCGNRTGPRRRWSRRARVLRTEGRSLSRWQTVLRRCGHDRGLRLAGWQADRTHDGRGCGGAFRQLDGAPR